MSALDWHMSVLSHTCLYPLQFPAISISEDEDLKNFLKIFYLAFTLILTFGKYKFSCPVGFHLKEESNNTELAGTFEHSLVCLHDASTVSP